MLETNKVIVELKRVGLDAILDIKFGIGIYTIMLSKKEAYDTMDALRRIRLDKNESVQLYNKERFRFTVNHGKVFFESKHSPWLLVMGESQLKWLINAIATVLD